MSRISRALVAPLTLAAVLVAPLLPGTAVASPPRDFDLQAHRGGLGLTVESTLPAFAKALELGVSTLELDVQITEDRVAVVTHDRRVSGQKCRDTAPETPDDPEFPYVGKYVNTLTLAQVRTLDCGSQRQAAHPDQELHPGERMPTLSQVLDLVDAYDARDVTLNIETKVEAGAPTETAPREQFVQEVVTDVRAAGLVDQVTIQSFDWGALMRMREVEPRFPLVALTNRDFLQVDQPGASPWLGGLDIDDFDDSLVRAAASFGASAISPVHGFPQDGKVTDPGYEPYVTRAMVEEAHAADLAVVPWTVDDRPTMASLMDKGVDGLITDYPDRLRDADGRPRPAAAPRLPAAASYDGAATRPGARPQRLRARPPAAGRPLPRVHQRRGRRLARRRRAARRPRPRGRRARAAPSSRSTSTRWSTGSAPRAARSTTTGTACFQLLIDVKSEAGPTYAAIDDGLREHRRIMTSYAGGRARTDAVTAVISGNRDLPAMQAQERRFAGYDGRLTDLDSGCPPPTCRWSATTGPSTSPGRASARCPRPSGPSCTTSSSRAHDAGYRLRFWATPDTPGAARDAVWRELLAAGVDQVNTDDLAGLEAFLRGQDR